MVISVVGATGYMGGMIVGGLIERGQTVRAVGRDAERVAALAARHPSLTTEVPAQWDAVGLATAIQGSEVVVACAGPFKLAGAAVVDAAISAGAHYCDSTGEPTFIQSVYDLGRDNGDNPERISSAGRRSGGFCRPSVHLRDAH